MSTLVDKADEDIIDDENTPGDEDVTDDENISDDDDTDDVIDDGEDDETPVSDPEPLSFAAWVDKEPTPLHTAFTEWISEQTGYEADLKTVQLAVVLHPRFQKSNFNKQRNAERAAAAKIERERAAKERAEKAAAAKAEREKKAAEAKAEKERKAAEEAAKPKEAGIAESATKATKAAAAKPGPKKAGQRGKTPTTPAPTTRRRPAATEETKKADEEF